MKKKNDPKNKTDKQNSNDSQDNFDWKRASKTSFLWIFIIFGAVYLSSLLTENGKKEIEIEYTEYRKYLQNGDIQKAVIIGDVFHGEFRLPQSIVTPMGNTLENVSHFKLTSTGGAKGRPPFEISLAWPMCSLYVPAPLPMPPKKSQPQAFKFSKHLIFGI